MLGTVQNNSDGVVIHCSCPSGSLDLFVTDIKQKSPSVAHIESIAVQSAEDSPVYSDFSISSSKKHNSSSIYISPDLALCKACHAEMFDSENPRYHHPFINCTACGSRYSIISDTPYDRPVTSMAPFAMCKFCAKEYVNVRNRRFHAEPVCCPECGPQCVLTLLTDESSSHDFAECGDFLRIGMIGAVQGIGGYQICCDATNNAGVKKVRDFKSRPDKPFAIMAKSLTDINKLCHVSPKEQTALGSSARPIVLLRLKTSKLISPQICRGNSHIGVMLPPSGVHQLVFHYSQLPFLLMTSANRANEPLITTAKSLRQNLSALLDFCIDHDRIIVNRLDDSVLMVQEEKERLVRRARGYVPQPIVVPILVNNILALGGQQKNTFAMGRRHEAFLSPHIGTLGYLETNQFLLDTIDAYRFLFQFDHTHIVHDLHPTYDTTRIAADSNLKTLAVQHHHAHHASCMAEHQLTEPCIGIILDGSGYGNDGTIWGGEILLADFSEYTRLFHFNTVLMPGGEQAVKKPFRMALAYLAKFLTEEELRQHYGSHNDFQMVYGLLEKGGVVTSSCGRLFDTVAYLLGLIVEVTFEGQAAIMVEQWAEQSNADEIYEPVLVDEMVQTLPTINLIRDVWFDLQQGTAKADICRKFLNSLPPLLLKAAKQVRQETAVNKVVFSGGVFQNKILSADCTLQFTQAGFVCFSQEKVPCNDGGLSLGQLCVAGAILNKENSAPSS